MQSKSLRFLLFGVILVGLAACSKGRKSVVRPHESLGSAPSYSIDHSVDELGVAASKTQPLPQDYNEFYNELQNVLNSLSLAELSQPETREHVNQLFSQLNILLDRDITEKQLNDLAVLINGLCPKDALQCERLRILKNSNIISATIFKIVSRVSLLDETETMSRLFFLFSEIASEQFMAKQWLFVVDHFSSLENYAKSIQRGDQFYKMLQIMEGQSIPIVSDEIVERVKKNKPWVSYSRKNSSALERLMFILWLKSNQQQEFDLDLCQLSLDRLYEKAWSLDTVKEVWNSRAEERQSCYQKTRIFVEAKLAEESKESAKIVKIIVDRLSKELDRRDYFSQMNIRLAPYRLFWTDVNERLLQVRSFALLHLIPQTALTSSDPLLLGFRNLRKNVDIYAEFPTLVGVLARLREFESNTFEYNRGTVQQSVALLLKEYFDPQSESGTLKKTYFSGSEWQPLSFREVLYSLNLALKLDLFSLMGVRHEEIIALFAGDWMNDFVKEVEQSHIKFLTVFRAEPWSSEEQLCQNLYNVFLNSTKTISTHQVQNLSSFYHSPIYDRNSGWPGLASQNSAEETVEGLRLELTQRWLQVKAIHELFVKHTGEKFSAFDKRQNELQYLAGEIVDDVEKMHRLGIQCYTGYQSLNQRYVFHIYAYEARWLRDVRQAYLLGDQKLIKELMDIGMAESPFASAQRVDGDYLVYNLKSFYYRIHHYIKFGYKGRFNKSGEPSHLPPIDRYGLLKIKIDNQILLESMGPRDSRRFNLEVDEDIFLQNVLSVLTNHGSNEGSYNIQWMSMSDIRPMVEMMIKLISFAKLSVEPFISENRKNANQLSEKWPSPSAGVTKSVGMPELVDSLLQLLALADIQSDHYKEPNYRLTDVLRWTEYKGVVPFKNWLPEAEELVDGSQGRFRPYLDYWFNWTLMDTYTEGLGVPTPDEMNRNYRPPEAKDNGYFGFAAKEFLDWTSEGEFFFAKNEDLYKDYAQSISHLALNEFNNIHEVKCLLKDSIQMDTMLRRYGSSLSTYQRTLDPSQRSAYLLNSPDSFARADSYLMSKQRKFAELRGQLDEQDIQFLPHFRSSLECETVLSSR